MRIPLKILFISCLLVGGFFIVKPAYAATEFISIVDPDNGSGTNFTSLSVWESSTQADLATTTTKTFSISSASGTFAVGGNVTGATSAATASSTYHTATQVLIYNISGVFQSGETVYVTGQATSSNYVILSNTGDAPIAVASARSSAGTADVTAVTINGWTTASTTYIKIWTDPTTGARHNGKWDEGKYRLEVVSASDSRALQADEAYVRIDGLQISADATGANYVDAIGFPTAYQNNGGHRVSNSILKGLNDDYGSGIYINNTYAYLWNNIIYDFTGSTAYGIYSNNGSVNNGAYVYNNTLMGNDYGLRGNLYVYTKNNIFHSNTNATSNQTAANNGYNATDLASLGYAAQTGDKVSQTFSFVDETNKDFHLSPTDTAARNAGTNLQTDADLPFSQDIDGSYRGAAWDIGADEVPTEFVSTICENTSAGGGCANLDYRTLSTWETAVDSDLTASGTRVFSGTASGTLANGNTVTLYNGATSTGITGTIVATTTSQILIQNITGTTTPVNVASGTVWQVTSANTWRNSGTLDQLGASPIAVAKIDGAWASADTTAFDVDGWTTSYDNYIKIYTTTAARHSGTWNTGKYRLAPATGIGLSVFEEYVWIDGLQVNSSNNSGFYSAPTGTSETRISNNLVKGNATNNVMGIAIDNSGTGSKAFIWNNIIYDYTGTTRGTGIYWYYANLTPYAYNNTLYNNTIGFDKGLNTVEYLKNNIVKANTTCYRTNGEVYINDDSYNNYNICSLNETTGGTNDKASTTIQFVDAANGNFHLADTDTAAKGAGVNLYSTSTLSVTNDIDSAARPTAASGLGFDIGADQTAVKIYRSIAPGASVALSSGASNALSISSSTSLATFATALADNIGVGDVIIYNTGGTATGTAFIHGRSSSTVYTVKTASGTAPTAVSADTSWSIYRAYTSLSNAEAGTENTGIVNTAIRNFDVWSGGADLVASNTQWNIAAYANGTTADTNGVWINGWTTGAQNYIKVYTPTAISEVGTSQRHQGKWDTNKYSLNYSSGCTDDSAIGAGEDFVRIDGLQVSVTATQNCSGMGVSSGVSASASEHQISNNIIKATSVSGNYNRGIVIAGGKVSKIWNNIIYDFAGTADFGINIVSYAGGTVYVYNNTVYNSYNGIHESQNGNIAYAKNNIVQGATDSYYSSTGWGSGSDYNISNTAEAIPSPSYRDDLATNVSFVDATNKDFHLAPTDTAALDAGTSTPATDANLSFTDDIDGQVRRQWDIGADEGSVEYVTSVMQSGGRFSTLSAWEAANQVDLAATTTAVFSLTSATGTIPANSSVVGLTSGAVASTTVGSVSTSTQILLYNIASSTFLTGETVYIQGGSTTTNKVVLSNAGNPAIATAKIDGAWTAADTTAVTIDGWTTGPNNYVRVYTTPTARHNGKWDDGKYRLEVIVTPGSQALMIGESHTRIDGIQILVTPSGQDETTFSYDGIRLENAINVRLSSNIIRADLTSWVAGTTRAAGIQGGVDVGGSLYIWNNLIYDFNYATPVNARGILVVNHASGKTYLYNNTVVNSGRGIIDGYSDIVAKNNVSYDNTDNYFDTFDASSANNLSGPTQTDAPGSNPRNGVTVAFVDEANKDFHLSPTDTAAKNAGVNLNTDPSLGLGMTGGADIDGSYRGAAWDIGADEVPTEFVSTICENASAGGGCATLDKTTLSAWESDVNSDLTASTTRVFSGSRTGTFNDEATLTLYRGASSTGITAVAVATTSSQILLKNISAGINYSTSTISTSSLLVLNVQNGNQWRLDASNYWTASGTADQLGASPIAVAKIDGAWTGAEGNGVTIAGWTTNHDNYIKIYTTTLARHDGKWNTNKYRMTPSGENGITNFADYIWIDGLQISVTASSGSYLAGVTNEYASSNSDIKISNNIIRGILSGTAGSGNAQGIYSSDENLRVWNNIIYDWINGAYVNIRGISLVNYSYVYSNTVYNCKVGIYNGWSNKVILKNNIIQNCENGYDGGSWSSLGDYNISDIAGDAPNATFATTSKIVRFVSTSTADFHLADTDTSAKGAGVNLYNDANINVVNDIDSAGRPATSTIGLNWDIGADQTAVKIYRSIAPGLTAALTTGASNAMTISSSTSLATFATALADNIGVGDVIIYNTGGSATGTAFIHTRASSTQYTVKTASGTLPTAVSADTSWSIYRAYISLSNAEAGTENTGIPSAMRNFDAWSGGVDLVASNTQWNIAAYANGTTADTATMGVYGWNTGAQNYLKIYTPTVASEVGASQRHQGKWDDSKYRLESNADGDAIWMEVKFIKFDGLQIKKTHPTNTASTIYNGGVTNTEISNSIIWRPSTAGSGPFFVTGTDGLVLTIWNTVIYGGGHNYVISDNWYNSVVTVYNSTIIGASGSAFSRQGGGTWVIKNTYGQSAGSVYNGTITLTSSASSDSSGSAGLQNIANSTANFTNVTPGSEDYHLSSNSALKDVGTSTSADAVPLNFTDDIDGNYRRQWDIGADEGSVEYVTSVMQSGGNFSSLSAWEAANQVDLTATTTAVFSLSSATGTIPANSSVVGLTSGAVASTTVGASASATSTQILLYNIASSTFLSGERIYIKGGATTSNYAIISNAGNPAIATAKIDGAWAGADTTAVTFNGWTTGPNNYIRIYTTPTARHRGKWDSSKYRLKTSTNWSIALLIEEDYIRADGLQISSEADNSDGIWFNATLDGEKRISGNIIRNTAAIPSGGITYDGNSQNTSSIFIAYNNLIYNTQNGIYLGIPVNPVTVKVYNNTVYNAPTESSWSRAYYYWGPETNAYFKNNIGLNSSAGYSGEDYSGGFGNHSNNISSDATSPDIAYRSKTVLFVDLINGDFHLAPTDTVAKDAGADLSADANLPFSTDIDGQNRSPSTSSGQAVGTAWDIGADEGATIAYRSVGNYTGDLNSGAATVTIANATSSSLATFSSGLATNIGVGDVIQYGPPAGYSLAFITGRASSTVYSIVSATGSLPVATTSATASIYRAHTLLNNWQTQTTAAVNQSISAGLRPLVLVARDLVASNTAMFVPAYASSSPDTTGVTIDNWTTGIANYIRIYTPNNANEVGVSQRHQGKWDDGKYRISVSNSAAITLLERYINISGLQVSIDSTNGPSQMGIKTESYAGSEGEINIDFSIIRGYASNVNNYHRGISIWNYGDGKGIKVKNNIIYDFKGGTVPAGILSGTSNGSTIISYFYNNTVYNNDNGIYDYSGNTMVAKNNISYNNTDNYVGTFSATSTNNLSGPTQSDAPGSNPQNAKVVNFIDAANRDFHLAPTDRAARDAGVDLSGDIWIPASAGMTKDIDGDTRPKGPAWDIGADEAIDAPDFQMKGNIKFKGNVKFVD